MHFWQGGMHQERMYRVGPVELGGKMGALGMSRLSHVSQSSY